MGAELQLVVSPDVYDDRAIAQLDASLRAHNGGCPCSAVLTWECA